MFLIANEPEKQDKFSAMLTITNLSVDPLEKLALFLPEKLRQCEELFFLDLEGEWQKMQFEKTADGVLLKHPFNYTEFVHIMMK